MLVHYDLVLNSLPPCLDPPAIASWGPLDGLRSDGMTRGPKLPWTLNHSDRDLVTLPRPGFGATLPVCVTAASLLPPSSPDDILGEIWALPSGEPSLIDFASACPAPTGFAVNLTADRRGFAGTAVLALPRRHQRPPILALQLFAGVLRSLVS